MTKLEFSAGGVVFCHRDKEREFVLIFNPYGKWTFPKGRIEPGEKTEVAALRETTEEIGIKNLKSLGLIKKIDYWFRKDETLIHKYVYFYLMEAPFRAKLTPQKGEIKTAKWFKTDQALKNLGYPKEDRAILEKAITTTNQRFSSKLS